jgi:hypothetical protein
VEKETNKKMSSTSTRTGTSMSQDSREPFIISIDLGTLDACADNVPPTIETLRAVTVRATERATLREWSASLEQLARELADAPTDKHSLFTRKNVIRAIKQLIARDQGIKVMYQPSASSLVTIVFVLSAQSDILPDTITDELALTLEPIAQTGDDLRIKQLVKRAEEQDAEIARLASIIAGHGAFARDVAINARVTQIIGLYGPLSRRSYALAQRVMAAEVDGKPIIFRALGCDAPIWLRSVIRFVNASEPSKICPVWTNRRDEILDETGNVCIGSGNATSSRSLKLHEWIVLRSHECMCNVLVILPVHDNYGEQKCFMIANCGTFHGLIIDGHHSPFSSQKTCANEIVIFGNPFIPADRSKECLTQLDNLRTNLKPWLKYCTNVHVADLRFADAQTADACVSTSACASYPGDFLYQYSEEVARAYETAEDADPWLDIVQKKWTYPMRVVNISRNLK